MPNPTNFTKFQNGPIDQRTWYSIPQVSILEDTNALDLQNTVNTFLNGLALPLTNQKYSIVAIQHSITGTGNNVTYSALIHYKLWQAV